MRKIFCIIFVGVLMWSVTGCLSSVKYSSELDAPPKVEMYYGDLALSGDVHDRWWELYGDSALSEFVSLVLKESPTLQSAYIKMVDSALALKQTRAGYYPDLSFSAGASYGGRVSEAGSTHDPNYSMGLSLSYEVDLWGKVRAQSLVSELALETASDSAQTAALSLVANVVTQWFTIQYYRDRRGLTEQLLQISESYLALVEDYYRSGQSNGMDVLEQRQQVESLRATLNEIESNIRIGQRALEIMAAGKTQVTVEGTLPEAIDVGGTPDLESLLLARSDVRSARRAVQTSDAQIVIALADRLPSLRLSASMSLGSSSIVDLFKALAWSIGASFGASLFDGFRKTTQIERAKLTYISQRAAYFAKVMEVVAEVESAILTLHLREQSLMDARAQLERQKEILEVSRQFFVGGNVTYNRVLTALRAMINAAQSELDARRQLLNAQIALFKAMGGGQWVKDIADQGAQNARERLENLGDEP